MKINCSKLTHNLQMAQNSINHGRGLDCVDTIIFFLNRGEINKAIACARNEWDKISSYEELSGLLLNLIHSDD